MTASHRREGPLGRFMRGFLRGWFIPIKPRQPAQPVDAEWEALRTRGPMAGPCNCAACIRVYRGAPLQ